MSADSSLVHLFVDEAGDTTLFGRFGKILVGDQGVSRFFVVGRLEVDDAAALEADLNALRTELLADPLLQGAPSMQPERGKTARFFHAKDDLPEVRLQVFRVLRKHDIRFSAVVKDKQALLAEVRLRETTDAGFRYKADGHDLYDAMLHALFGRIGRIGLNRKVMFAIRGNKPRTYALTMALIQAESHIKREFGIVVSNDTVVHSSYPWDHAGLQACDYFLWALQRFYERSEERFLTAMWPQFIEVIDLELPGPKERGKPQKAGTTFNEKHPLNLANRAGVGRENREI